MGKMQHLLTPNKHSEGKKQDADTETATDELRCHPWTEVFSNLCFRKYWQKLGLMLL